MGLIELNLDPDYFPMELSPRDRELYEIVDKTVAYYDREKGYEDIDVTIREKSTGIYFRTTVEDWGHGVQEYDDNWKIVYPHTKLVEVTTYKTEPNDTI
jgi:hypothetical protein